MNVKMRLLCVEIPFDRAAPPVDIELPASATVENALKSYMQKFNIDFPFAKMKESSFFVNKNVAELDTVLEENDSLLVIRTLAGG